VSKRTIPDRLREEYFDLLPEISLVASEIAARIQFHILEISQNLDNNEHLIVKARVKRCDSAIAALETRVVAADQSKQGAGELDRLGTFNPDTPDEYSLTQLHDLAGVRVLAFPPRRLKEIDVRLREFFNDWTTDPFKNIGDQIAFKYFGRCPKSSLRVQGEYQIVSMLTGLFWEVEHAAIYKRTPNLKNLPPIMQERTDEVNRALMAFENEFEHQLERAKATGSSFKN
jgi:hypothetical protein